MIVAQVQDPTSKAECQMKTNFPFLSLLEESFDKGFVSDKRVRVFSPTESTALVLSYDKLIYYQIVFISTKHHRR